MVEQFKRGPKRPPHLSDSEMWDRVEKTITGQHFAKTLGLSVVAVKHGEVTLKMPVRPELNQQMGFVHGGAIAALLDTATGMVTATLLDETEGALTTEMKVNYLGPGEGQYLLATARVIKDGARLVIMEAEAQAVLHDGKERDVAHMTTSYIRFPRNQ